MTEMFVSQLSGYTVVNGRFWWGRPAKFLEPNLIQVGIPVPQKIGPYTVLWDGINLSVNGTPVKHLWTTEVSSPNSVIVYDPKSQIYARTTRISDVLVGISEPDTNYTYQSADWQLLKFPHFWQNCFETDDCFSFMVYYPNGVICDIQLERI